MVTDIANRGLSASASTSLAHGEPVDGRPAGRAGHVRHQARAAARRPGRLGDRPPRRGQRAGERARPRPHRRTACTSSPPCPGLDGRPTPKTLPDGVGRAGARASAPRWARRGRAGACGCCPPCCRTRRCRRRTRRGRRSRSASPRPTCGPVLPRLRRRAALPAASATSSAARARFLRGLAPGHRRARTTRPRPGSSWSTTGAACSARCEPSTCIGYGTSPQVTADLVTEVATVMKERLPGPDVTAEQLRDPQLVDRARSCTSWSTTTTWSPARRSTRCRRCWIPAAGPRHRPAPRADPPHPAARAGRMFDPVIGGLRELASPGIMMSGTRDEGALFGTDQAAAAAPGPGVAGHPPPRCPTGPTPPGATALIAATAVGPPGARRGS